MARSVFFFLTLIFDFPILIFGTSLIQALNVFFKYLPKTECAALHNKCFVRLGSSYYVQLQTTQIRGFSEANGDGDDSKGSVERAEGKGFKLPSYGSFALGSGLSQFPKRQKCARLYVNVCVFFLCFFYVLQSPYTKRGNI